MSSLECNKLYSGTSIINLARNPGFELTSETPDGRNDFNLPPNDGGIYTHVHNTAKVSKSWKSHGSQSLVVHGTTESNDTFICPGGRNEDGTFRLGMRPGETYTAQVNLHLGRRLQGPLRHRALSIVVGCIAGGTTHWSYAASDPAPNQRGTRHLSVTFTLPENATAAWIKLSCGMQQDHGSVQWDDFILTNTIEPIRYFDGDTNDDEFFTYSWTGVPHASPSTKTLRQPSELLFAPTGELYSPERVLDVFRRLAPQATYENLDSLYQIALEVCDFNAAHRSKLEDILVTARRQVQRTRLHLTDAATYVNSPGHHVQTARTLADQGRWRAATSSLKRAVELAPGNASLRYELGTAYDKAGDTHAAKLAFSQAIDLDIPLPFDAHAVLESFTGAFASRREIGLFIAEHLDEIRRRSDSDPGGDQAVPGNRLPVFSYWAQGLEQAPPLVRRCVSRTRDAALGSAHVLTDDDVAFYVDLPRRITRGLDSDKTHFSDMLRLELLHRYGGAWFDATCWLSEPVDSFLDKYLVTDFTAPRIGPGRLSNWFLAAKPGSRMIAMLRHTMHLWWEEHPYVPHYFYMHHIFEMLYWLDEEFRQGWDAASGPSSSAAHAFQARLLDPSHSVDLQELLQASSLQKLTYKFKQSAVRPDSFLARIIRGDAGLLLQL